MKDFFKNWKIGRFATRNLLIILFALFICAGVGVSAYFGSDTSEVAAWQMNITHAPSTPTQTLVPDTGWWNEVATPGE
jgi:hypothetical protein